MYFEKKQQIIYNFLEEILDNSKVYTIGIITKKFKLFNNTNDLNEITALVPKKYISSFYLFVAEME